MKKLYPSQIRKIYSSNFFDLIKDYHDGKRIETIDWRQYLNAPEWNVYCEILCQSLPLYPQFPVDNYLVDFGDPIQKIAIEVDGLKYHSHMSDVKRDRRRQYDLENMGWTVYRIFAADTKMSADDFLQSRYSAVLDDDKNEFKPVLETLPFDLVKTISRDLLFENSDLLIKHLSLKYYSPRFEAMRKAAQPFVDEIASFDNRSKQQKAYHDLKAKVLKKISIREYNDIPF